MSPSGVSAQCAGERLQASQTGQSTSKAPARASVPPEAENLSAKTKTARREAGRTSPTRALEGSPVAVPPELPQLKKMTGHHDVVKLSKFSSSWVL